MTRKDTILIAVVINAGLLAVLFLAAVIYDTGKGGGELDSPSILEGNAALQINSQPNLIAAASDGDEVDNVLKYYAPSTVQPIVLQTDPETVIEPFPPPAANCRTRSRASVAGNFQFFQSRRLSQCESQERGYA